MNLDAFFKATLEASWQASLVILLILLLRPLLGLRVPARWRSLLWLLVLLRLLVPAFLLPSSPASLQNIAVVDRPIEQAALVLRRTDPREQPPIELRRQGPAPDELISTPTEGAPVSPRRRLWWLFASIAWLSGTVLAAIWIFAATVHLHLRVRRGSTPARESIENVWHRCCARLSLRHPPRLLATNCVESPALIGLLRPALLIPRDAQLSPEDWEHVFMHELAHFRRRDHWTQVVQLLALCAHWFNPLVWLGFRYLRADRELAADEWALRHLEGSRAVAYGDTLLKVLTAQAGHAVPRCMVGIMEDGTQMKQRLRHIVAFTPRRLAGSVTGIVLVLVLAVAVLGREQNNVDLTNYEGLAPAEILVTAAREADRPVLEKMLADRVNVNSIASLKGERTALAAAVAANQIETVHFLVAKGADVNLKPEKADAPIVIALKKGAPELAEFLLSKGAACDAELLAAAKGDAGAVEKFIASQKPDFEKLKTLCEIAAANGHASLFGTIYDAIRALPERENWEAGHGLASIAIARGQRAVIEEMLKRGEDLNKSGVMRLAPVADQTPGMRAWLQSKGFSIPNFNDGERLIEAAECENLPDMRRLLAAGVDVNYRGESDWTPISKAGTWGCPRAVRLLIEHRAEPNPKKHSYTTLSLAKTPEIADLLFAAGARVKPDDINYSLARLD